MQVLELVDRRFECFVATYLQTVILGIGILGVIYTVKEANYAVEKTGLL